MNPLTLTETVQALAGELGQDAAIRRLLNPEPTGTVTPNDLDVAKRTLSRSVVRWVVESSWSSQECLCGGSRQNGRLWSRHSAPATQLEFGPVSSLLLQAALEGRLLDSVAREALSRKACSSVGAVTIADRLTFAMTGDSLRHTELGRAIASLGLRSGCDYVLWTAPEDVPDSLWADDDRLSKQLSESEPWGLEVMSHHLASTLLRLELAKWRSHEPAEVINTARLQSKLLKQWVGPCHEQGRPDLNVPLLSTVRNGLQFSERTCSGLGARLARGRGVDPTQLQKSLMVLGPALMRFQELADSLREVSYFDEGYEAAQLWLSAWETHEGGRLVERFRVVERQTASALGAAAAIAETWK